MERGCCGRVWADGVVVRGEDETSEGANHVVVE